MRFLWPLCTCFKGEEGETDERPAGDHPEPVIFQLPDQIVERPSALRDYQQPSQDESAINLQSSSLEGNVFKGLFCLDEVKSKMHIVSGESYRYASGAMYTGDWRNNVPHGNGEMRWSSDRWYRGAWDSGLPVHGQMQLSPGVAFEGSWKNSEFHSDWRGFTELRSFDMWLQCVSDGFGTFHAVWLWFELHRQKLNNSGLKFPTSTQEIEDNVLLLHSIVKKMVAIIHREIQSDKPNSSGFICNRSGLQVYKGCHIESKPHGIGELSYGPKCAYIGEFFEGKMQGFGVYSWPNGKSHSGWWRAGERHGYGVFQDSDGSKLAAHWDNGHLIDQL